MFNKVVLYIAFRYWRIKGVDSFGRLVSTLASIGIVLGITALIIVLSVMNGLEKYQKQQILTSIPHAIISPQLINFDYTTELPTFPAYVTRTVPINTTNVVLQSTTTINAGVLLGVKNNFDDPKLNYYSQEELDELLPINKYQVIISYDLAHELKLNIGDKIRLMVADNSQFTPFGRVPVQRLFKVSAIYNSYNADEARQIYANITDVGRLMRINPDQYQGLRVFLRDPFLITKLINDFPTEKWDITDWRKQKGEFFQAVKMESNIMGLLISLIIIVAISNIITSLSLMVVDKQNEIAILQTQGLKKRNIMGIFMLQGLYVGLVGVIIGTIIGIFATVYLEQILLLFSSQAMLLPTLIKPSQIIAIIMFSLSLSFIATIYPAYRASKIEPAEALRYE